MAASVLFDATIDEDVTIHPHSFKGLMSGFRKACFAPTELEQLASCSVECLG